MIHTTRRLLTAYAETEPHAGSRDQRDSPLDLEEHMAWGVHILQGLMELEARLQSRATQTACDADERVEIEQILQTMPHLYQLWAEVSEEHLSRATVLVESDHPVAGVDRFREALEEARAMLGNAELEARIRPIEELVALAKPENPRPDRYGD